MKLIHVFIDENRNQKSNTFRNYLPENIIGQINNIEDNIY